MGAAPSVPPDARDEPRWYQRCQAALLAWTGQRYERLVAERKRALLAPLAGTVVEIGPGTGPNLAYYSDSVRWIGVEPNPYLEPYLRRAAARRGRAIEVRRGVAERLPLADASADAVVSTLVLCSVRDPEVALAEIVRVLRPGGRFVFLEHVAAPPGTALRAVQRLLRPLWRRAAGGCHPDRETWRTIERAGFRRLELEQFRLPVGPVAPHVAGLAEK